MGILSTEGLRKTSTRQKQIVQENSFRLKTHGKLDVDLFCNVEIHPPNPFEEMERSDGENNTFVELSSTNIETTELKNLNFVSEANHNNDELYLTSSTDDTELCENVHCTIETPLKFDISVKVRGSCSISNTEGGTLNVKSFLDDTPLTLHNIKSGDIDVMTAGDVVSSKLLQGNASLQTQGMGCITGDRLQGQRFKVTSDAGNINIKTLYGTSSQFYSKQGSITIGNCHGDCDCYLKNGNLKIDSLDGSLTADVVSGNVEVQVTRHRNIDIQVLGKGDITLKLPEDIVSNVGISGSDVHIDKSLNYTPMNPAFPNTSLSEYIGVIGKSDGQTDNFITIRSKSGAINIEKQDWFSSLNLGKLEH
ncbi:unnamed protein product [Owenia fusiformis]|uniref:DUF4097 domain-containing protein n=1 Tax=Owenia fusiformis TaxID=6347 RepID=A0A8S4NR70_OWEFU|nr:unnamed protein product [Owenia fusiformis]